MRKLILLLSLAAVIFIAGCISQTAAGPEICGNSQLEGKETCDPPKSSCGYYDQSGAFVLGSCSENCECNPVQQPLCGNGNIDAGEDCDPPGIACAAALSGQAGTCTANCLCSAAQAAPQCTGDIQCNDANACTADDCNPDNICVNTPISPCCGNRAAEAGENCANCPADANCVAGEQCINGKCARCGDGSVQEGENCANCPADVACPVGKQCVNGICMECASDANCQQGRHCCTIVSPGPGPFAGGAAALNKCLECCLDSHCDDFSPCTKDTCSSNQCAHEQIMGCR